MTVAEDGLVRNHEILRTHIADRSLSNVTPRHQHFRLAAGADNPDSSLLAVRGHEAPLFDGLERGCSGFFVEMLTGEFFMYSYAGITQIRFEGRGEGPLSAGRSQLPLRTRKNPMSRRPGSQVRVGKTQI